MSLRDLENPVADKSHVDYEESIANSVEQYGHDKVQSVISRDGKKIYQKAREGGRLAAQGGSLPQEHCNSLWADVCSYPQNEALLPVLSSSDAEDALIITYLSRFVSSIDEQNKYHALPADAQQGIVEALSHSSPKNEQEKQQQPSLLSSRPATVVAHNVPSHAPAARNVAILSNECVLEKMPTK